MVNQEGFQEWVKGKWPNRYKHDVLDHWHIISGKLRRAIKGWGQNVDSAQKKVKQELIKNISRLDDLSDERDLMPAEWEERYNLEENLQKILRDEELHWQRRGGERWILEGDSNTGYFHKCANGRKRKMQITFLEYEGQCLIEPQLLREHITDYYKQLFGSVELADIHLEPDMWPTAQQLSQQDREALIRPFCMEELDYALKEMRNNTAPGPDGFNVEFFKAFWPLIRGDIKEMLDKLFAGVLDLRRLNYGVIILILKVKPTINIKQFWPICLLNVIYKIITKVLTIRLTAVVDKVINHFQTAFIPGRNILEGVVILQEVLHDQRMSKKTGVILKLDFEKAYDKVSWNFLEEVLHRKGFPELWIITGSTKL